MARIALHDLAMNQFWSSLPENEAFLRNMETVESWVLDKEDTQFMNTLEFWAASLTDEQVHQLNEKAKYLLVILGFLSARRAYYLLSQLSESNKSLVNHLTSLALQLVHDPGYRKVSLIFIDRIKATAVHETFKMIFNTDRLGLIYRALDIVAKKNDGAFS